MPNRIDAELRGSLSIPDRVRPPAGAPNVVVTLIDDVGFGASGAFGGPRPA